MTRLKSSALWQKAQSLIPGGVNSPVRAFKAVGGEPLFIKKGLGSKIYDVDGNEYIDYVGSWGPLILGHAHPKVVKAIEKALHNGTSFGAPTKLEVKLAELIVKAFPSIELVRMVNSGTEATMSAIRLARGYTNRDKIIKMEGCYHGHVDSLLVKAGSGAATFGVPDSPGVPEDFVKHTISVPFNDAKSVKKAIESHPDQIACLIIEPVAGNMGVVPPKDGYLEEIRELTAQNGILLIFDEVITGFRAAYGGAQQLYKIKPDLTCLGKIIGGGLPVGAYGGKKEVMQNISPMGLKVYQAGTLSGNPLAMSAGIETLKILSDPKLKVYETLEERSKALEAGLKTATKSANVEACHTRVGSMLTTFFTKMEVVDYQSADSANRNRYAKYFHLLLEKGIYLAPSQLEAAFVSLAHSEEDIEKTIKMARKVMREM